MKISIFCSTINLGIKLYCLGVLIEYKRKKLNHLVKKGYALSSLEIYQANNALAPHLLRWQQLEETYLKLMSLRFFPLEEGTK